MFWFDNLTGVMRSNFTEHPCDEPEASDPALYTMDTMHVLCFSILGFLSFSFDLLVIFAYFKLKLLRHPSSMLIIWQTASQACIDFNWGYSSFYYLANG
jgi:hypothetical protein